MDRICSNNPHLPVAQTLARWLPPAALAPEKACQCFETAEPLRAERVDANRERFSITLRRTKSLRCYDPWVYPTGAIFLAGLETALVGASRFGR
jgi:hypothetical protein